MVEPVGATLAVVGVLHPLFVSCRALYKGYQLTQSFGEDFPLAQRRLEIQYARFENISQTKLAYLKHGVELQGNIDHYNTRAIVHQLVIIRDAFEDCNKVLEKYHQLEKRHFEMDTSAAGLEQITGTHRAVPLINPPSEMQFSSSTTIQEPSLQTASPLDWCNSPIESWKTRVSRKKKGREGAGKPLSSIPTISLEVATPTAIDRMSTLTLTENGEPVHKSIMLGNVLRPSILQAPIDTMTKEKHASQATMVKKSNTLVKRVVWATEDRDVIWKNIETIRNGYQDLESLLEYQDLDDPLQILQCSKSITSLENIDRIQASVKGLHDALASLNGANSSQQMGIAVQLRHDFEGLRNLLPEEDGLGLREDGLLFLLHIHGLQDALDGRHAVEILAEAPRDARQEILADPPKRLKCVEDLKSALSSELDAARIKCLGTVARPSSLSHEHQVFSTNERTWTKIGDLGQALVTDDFHEKLQLYQRVQLASLIAVTHGYFAKIRISCTEVRPANFHYYHTSSDSVPWDDEEPYILNPYISIGFGSRKPQHSLGSSSGVSQCRSKPVVELGLLLYQIGSGTSLDYGRGPEGFRRAKIRALHTIGTVDKGTGGRFAEVVQMCLKHSGSEEDDWKVIEAVETWLRDFGDKLGLP
ncbi:hypothetical protein CC86DRAFT_470268 [Ophiobolus disseminans]|uniref:Prion-inhibition and propagation HeLo domain-containing protein n=1 Tax=Ophiobolus disseminans TaxID=1469910 RepID=A0A6A6ZN22_9PLEO|nr:hypothetical protein CC86DRAFT_470268 [Ophiobolus disseminans]